jgi:hypothetical protein
MAQQYAPFIPQELIGKFDTFAEASKALTEYQKARRGAGRPKSRDVSGHKIADLKKMLKPSHPLNQA